MRALTIAKLHNQKLINEANKFIKSGILARNDNYYFLKVEDNFIHKLYPLLLQDKRIEKPDYFSCPNTIGAHITVVYEEENVTLNVNDLGQIHDFEIKELCSAILDHKKYFVLIVSSTSLDALRSKYNLSSQPKYKNVHIDLHITVGVQLLESSTCT